MSHRPQVRALRTATDPAAMLAGLAAVITDADTRTARFVRRGAEAESKMVS